VTSHIKSDAAVLDDDSESAPGRAVDQESLRHKLLSSRYSGIWMLVGLVVLFSVAETHTFLSRTTLQTTLSDQSITGILALAILLPLVAGHVDLSVAAVAGFSLVVAAWLSAHTALATPLILIIVLGLSALIGLVCGLFVTRLGVNSLFVTLGVGTVVNGITEKVADHNTIKAEFGESYQHFARGYLFDSIPYLFLVVLVVAAILYYVLEHTPLGRRYQACGGNIIAAKLAGIRTQRLEVSVFLVSSTIAGLTGFLLAAKIGLATETIAQGYLLPAAAALFLGSTQFRARPNVAGILLAMWIMGTGIKGFQLMGASAWVTNFFAGSVLLLAVIISHGRVGRVR
jgi:ribose transport system permease protein